MQPLNPNTPGWLDEYRLYVVTFLNTIALLFKNSIVLRFDVMLPRYQSSSCTCEFVTLINEKFRSSNVQL